MSAFWHWYVIFITLGFIVWLVWMFVATARARVDSQAHDEHGETTAHVWDGDLREYNNPMPRWWLWLFYATVIFSLLYLVLYPGLGRYAGVLNWTQEGQYAEEMQRAAQAFDAQFAELAGLPLEQLVTDEQALRMGRNIFAHNCSTCHGSDARGAAGYPNLTDGHWTWGGSPERVLETIQHGRQAVMTPFGEILGPQGVNRAVAYVQQLAGQRVDATLAAAGQRIFEQQCFACHGMDGTGNTLLGAPDLTTGNYIYGGGIDSLRDTIRDGRMGVMPAQVDLLGEARTRLVAAYVLSLSQDQE